MELTLVEADLEGDAWFPEWDHAEWRELWRARRAWDAHNAYDLTFLRLERREGTGRA
jgi:dihydrofolate reductase